MTTHRSRFVAQGLSDLLRHWNKVVEETTEDGWYRVPFEVTYHPTVQEEVHRKYGDYRLSSPNMVYFPTHLLTHLLTVNLPTYLFSYLFILNALLRGKEEGYEPRVLRQRRTREPPCVNLQRY